MRRGSWILSLTMMVVVVALVATGCGSPATVSQSAARLPAAPVVKVKRPPPTGLTLVATMIGNAPGSPAPGAPSDQVVPAQWYGYPSVLPVIASKAGWLDVRLAQRPNMSTAWVPRADVTLGTTPYELVLNLTTEHLTVFQDGHQILDFPAGIGTTDDPTPTGSYFIAMKVPPPDPGYGAFVLATSDHSDAISDWEGSGDAVIGIHGPIDSYDDTLIGTTGARISHGCVRLHDADLAQLSMIPPGTPLDVIP